VYQIDLNSFRDLCLDDAKRAFGTERVEPQYRLFWCARLTRK